MAEQSRLYGSAGNSKVYAQKPYYNGYTPLPGLFEPKVAWAEDKPAQSGNVVEIVCSPNNPDGKMQTKQLPGELLTTWGKDRGCSSVWEASMSWRVSSLSP